MRTLETEAAIYTIFFQHEDFVKHINETFPGKPLDIKKCVPAITEVKPPHQIFLDLECYVNYFVPEIYSKDLSNDDKDNMVINFLIININHESLHKAIFEIPEIDSFLEKKSYQLNEAENNAIEYIIAKIEGR